MANVAAVIRIGTSFFTIPDSFGYARCSLRLYLENSSVANHRGSEMPSRVALQILLFALSLSLAGCSGDQRAASSSSVSTTAPEEDIPVKAEGLIDPTQ